MDVLIYDGYEAAILDVRTLTKARIHDSYGTESACWPAQTQGNIGIIKSSGCEIAPTVILRLFLPGDFNRV